MKKKKIYVNQINKKMDNNQNYCDVLEKKEEVIKENDSKKSVSEKLAQLFNTNGYIFNVNVKIITNNKTYDTKIAGKVNNHLITLDNNIININDIKDIIF